MPLVFAENEATESGITYADRTGVVYQFPARYRLMVQPGERFVYYRGRKRRSGKRALQVYFGIGVIGAVALDRSDANRFRCEILDYQEFKTPLPFRDASGKYFESGATRRGYFQQGVRRITDQDYQGILFAADALGEEGAVIGEAIKEKGAPRVFAFASRETIAKVESRSLEVAIELLGKRYPLARIELQPRNNPGFDVLLVDGLNSIFIEVKGTQLAWPQFFMTQGEVEFSRQHASMYKLLVIYGIDLASSHYETFWHEGAVTGDAFELSPMSWVCRAVSLA